MTPDVVYGFDDEEVHTAARLMARRQIRRLPVLNRRKQLVGMVALGDLAVHPGTQTVTAEVLEQVSEPGKSGRKWLAHARLEQPRIWWAAFRLWGGNEARREKRPAGGTMHMTSYTTEAIEYAIPQGAITEAYQADPQQVVV